MAENVFTVTPYPEDVYSHIQDQQAKVFEYGRNIMLGEGRSGKIPKQSFEIASSRFTTGLFDRLQARVFASILDRLQLEFYGYYRNNRTGYWLAEEVTELDQVLSKKYTRDILRHFQTENGFHLITVDDEVVETKFTASLGFENPEQQQQNYRNFIKKQREYEEFNPSDDEFNQTLNRIFREVYPKPLPKLYITCRHIDDDVLAGLLMPKGLMLPERGRFLELFTRWSGFIGVMVNSMAQVKGEPQIGTLVLQPLIDSPN